MWMTPHTMVGVTLAVSVPDPYLAGSLAFVSHYVLDFLPHWNQEPTFYGKKAIALYFDFFLALGLGLSVAFQFPLFSSQFWLVIICAAFANLPDAIRIPHLILYRNLILSSKRKTPYYYLERFHDFVDQDIQHSRAELVWKFAQGKVWLGISMQILVVIVSSYFLWRFFQ